MALTVIGIFDDAQDAQQAVNKLVDASFTRDSIDLSAQAGSTMAGSTGNDPLVADRHVNTSGTRTEELADDAKDVGSGIGSFFSSLFGSDDEADERNRYTQVADRGSVVTVHVETEDQAERAADILDEAGAVDVNERAAQYGYASSGTTNGPATEGGIDQGDQTVKVIEENLEVGKRTVETGGVRLRSRIVAKPVEENVRLRQERVTVNRTPVNRPATAADLDAFQEGEITMTEHAEVPVVSKTANVVEEISVGKAVSERDETIRDTVRKTEVDVEKLGTTDQPVRPAGTDTDEVTYSTK